MNASPRDAFGVRKSLATPAGPVHIYSLDALAAKLDVDLAKLPYSIRVLLEAALRHCDDYQVTQDDVKRLAGWRASGADPVELPFKPARVILQDFTGVPCVVDLAAMRDAVHRMGGDPRKINPLVPVDLVIDHSVQVDVFGTGAALEKNAEIEFVRNKERYEFLRWGQMAFSNFRVVPPATGIVHQVNLEYLAHAVLTAPLDGVTVAYPDTLVGTDSHTTMINGLGVVGWGVGGIEAEAVMLGQPLYLLTPQVVGFKLSGRLRDGVTATDLVLTVTQMLRKKGVVDKFVEFYGAGVSAMSLPDRATIANMAPEYGATIGFFPVDAETLRYLERTNRADAARLTEAYCKAQGLFRTDASPEPSFTDTLELDLGSVEASLAGPKRPQDRVALRDVKSTFHKGLTAPVKERGYGLPDVELGRTAEVRSNGSAETLGHGAVVIAAITSCTNTSNPSVMIGAGLLARKAVAKGLRVKSYVKTSLAPGSKVVTDYLAKSGTLADLEALGFNVVGYGCTSCIAEGTPVQLGDGTAVTIDQIPDSANLRLMGPDHERRLSPARQVATLDQGTKECVTLVLQDGRELVCTPDHRLLRADGTWVRADELAVGSDRVVMGLETPLDAVRADEHDYVLEAGSMRFTLAEPMQRRKALAFARLLGHLLSDRSISTNGQGRMNAGQALDREAMLADVELLTGKRPSATRYDDLKWSVVLPKELTDSVLALDGVHAGRRITQLHELPAFLLTEDCPVAIVREFLGGIFGADGHSPLLKRQGEDENSAVFGAPAFSRSAVEEHVESLRGVMRKLLGLLARCGVVTERASIYEYLTRRSASTYPTAQDGAPRWEVRLVLPDGLSFVERVGYRYCVDKSLRASAAAVYWRTVQGIGRQRVRMADVVKAVHAEEPELSFTKVRGRAEALMLEVEPALHEHYSLLRGHGRFDRLPEGDGRSFKPLHRDLAGFPSPVELLREIGARDWFSKLEGRAPVVEDKRYCVEKEALSLPTFSLAVIARRDAGPRRVFDLTVEGIHAFVAGGVCVHNCIGNSGPLPEAVAQAVESGKLVAAAVLSGNRNFEGRVNPLTRANYLASPPLVVAYALAGSVDVDLEREPLGTGTDGKPVYLREIWPTQKEIADAVAASLEPGMFAKNYGNVFDGNPRWNAIPVAGGERYAWDANSTYIHEPPFFQGLGSEIAPVRDVRGARCLVMVGDSVTTDHISPAGDIALASPAGKWLAERGTEKKDFNSYGSRRGHDQVMVRGTFANIRLKNLLVPGSEGNVTLHFPSGEQVPIFDASARYQAAGTPLIVLAGKEYGSGSSRDWAAKGTLMLGVRAVLCESFERIHRSNLVGMGVLPMVYEPGQTAEALGLTGRETFDLTGLGGELKPRQRVKLRAMREDGSVLEFGAIARLDTPVDVDYYRNGGILPTVLRKLAKS
jgi:aconitase A/intein/homing endonuclease